MSVCLHHYQCYHQPNHQCPPPHQNWTTGPKLNSMNWRTWRHLLHHPRWLHCRAWRSIPCPKLWNQPYKILSSNSVHWQGVSLDQGVKALESRPDLSICWIRINQYVTKMMMSTIPRLNKNVNDSVKKSTWYYLLYRVQDQWSFIHDSTFDIKL